MGRRMCVLAVVVTVAACAGAPATEHQVTSTALHATDHAVTPQSTTDRPRIVVLGDSLTAGLGVSSDEAYPARLQARLDAAAYDFEVVAAGESGGTTAGGLRRLEWALNGDVRILVVALGGNDGLRGLPVEQMKANLSAIIRHATERGVRVLLTGMEAPPNFGTVYTDEFRQVFREVAAEHDLAFVPFLLEGVAGVEELNQSDRIHPNAEGAEQVAAHLWPALEPLLGGP